MSFLPCRFRTDDKEKKLNQTHAKAFFPLIAITIIYFMLEGLFSLAVSRIRIRIDPRKRRRERILKGVNTHD